MKASFLFKIGRLCRPKIEILADMDGQNLKKWSRGATIFFFIIGKADFFTSPGRAFFIVSVSELSVE
ncbi:MAG: hypothetical protein IJ498_10135 [Akkermansia sp.]|nr:hypothetical protein [Akkermansia sp.]